MILHDYLYRNVMKLLRDVDPEGSANRANCRKIQRRVYVSKVKFLHGLALVHL